MKPLFAAGKKDKHHHEGHHKPLAEACKDELKAAVCAEGEGQAKCLHDHHEAHKDFKLSEDCHTALKHIFHKNHHDGHHH